MYPVNLNKYSVFSKIVWHKGMPDMWRHLFFDPLGLLSCKVLLRMLDDLHILVRVVFFLDLYSFYVWQLLGRNLDLSHLIGQRMNKVFRENLDYLFERFESQDLCSIVVSFQAMKATIKSSFPFTPGGQQISFTEMCTPKYGYISVPRLKYVGNATFVEEGSGC